MEYRLHGNALIACLKMHKKTQKAASAHASLWQRFLHEPFLRYVVSVFSYCFIYLHIHFISLCHSCLAEFDAVILCDDGEYFVS